MEEKTKEELQERALAVRALEAACKIEHPNADESAFRVAVMKRVGTALGLREMRGVSIAPPAGKN